MKVFNLLTFGLLLTDSSCEALRFPTTSHRFAIVRPSTTSTTSSSKLYLDVSHFIVPSSIQVQASSQSSASSSTNRSPLSFISSLAQSISNNPFWSKYSISLNFKPIRTKALSSMLGFIAGELVYQVIFNKVMKLICSYTLIL